MLPFNPDPVTKNEVTIVLQEINFDANAFFTAKGKERLLSVIRTTLAQRGTLPSESVNLYIQTMVNNPLLTQRTKELLPQGNQTQQQNNLLKWLIKSTIKSWEKMYDDIQTLKGFYSDIRLIANRIDTIYPLPLLDTEFRYPPPLGRLIQSLPYRIKYYRTNDMMDSIQSKFQAKIISEDTLEIHSVPSKMASSFNQSVTKLNRLALIHELVDFMLSNEKERIPQKIERSLEINPHETKHFIYSRLSHYSKTNNPTKFKRLLMRKLNEITNEDILSHEYSNHMSCSVM